MGCLKVENLSYSYSQHEPQVLDGISFEVNEGEVLGIIGSNGSGKTTLCYCLSGIIPHCLGGDMGGRVFVKEKDTKKTELHHLIPDIGIVLQDPEIQILMPTVEDEIAFGLENFNVPREEIKKRIYYTMELVGISTFKDENPNCLSGGQKQLVALASVLALNPSIVIFDESLSMLDEMAVERILFVMKKLKDKGTTLIIIDHTFKGIKLYDKVFVLDKGSIIENTDKDNIFQDKEFLNRHKIFI